ncbi:hypothetical protein D7252_06875 [Microbacterium sp. CGR2]|nr:hypothetical protein D7252_06875 [Microbacterium sp. CGR2]
MLSKTTAAIFGTLVLVASMLSAGSADADADAETAVDAFTRATPKDMATAVDVDILGSQASAPTKLVQPLTSDAGDGLSVGVGDGVLNIGLPFADDAHIGASTDLGTVTFDNANSTSSVVVIHEDSTVQVATFISSDEAPTRYDYVLDLPEGVTLSLEGTGAVLLDVTGHEVGAFASPWAKDANGKDVATHYEVDGATLTQIVNLDGDIAYPVVADPSYTTSSIYISKAEVRRMYSGLRNLGSLCSVVPIPWPLSISCAGLAPRTAIEQAYWQNKRVRVDYRSCGFNYCSSTSFYVVA